MNKEVLYEAWATKDGLEFRVCDNTHPGFTMTERKLVSPGIERSYKAKGFTKITWKKKRDE